MRNRTYSLLFESIASYHRIFAIISLPLNAFVFSCLAVMIESIEGNSSGARNRARM